MTGRAAEFLVTPAEFLVTPTAGSIVRGRSRAAGFRDRSILVSAGRPMIANHPGSFGVMGTASKKAGSAGSDAATCDLRAIDRPSVRWWNAAAVPSRDPGARSLASSGVGSSVRHQSLARSRNRSSAEAEESIEARAETEALLVARDLETAAMAATAAIATAESAAVVVIGVAAEVGAEATGRRGDLLDWPPRFEPGRSK